MNRRAKGEGSIYRQGASWIAQVTIGKRVGGSLVRRTKKCATKKAAVAALAALRARYQHGQAALCNVTVAGWLDIWFKRYKMPNLRANSAQSYAYPLQRLKEIIGERKLEDLSPLDVQDALTMLSDRPRTAKFAYTLLRAALRRAVLDGVLARDVTVGIDPPIYSPQEASLPSPAQLAAILSYPSPAYWRPLLLLAAVTGARLSELLALQTTDIDGQTVHIRHALILGRNKAKGQARPLIRETTKTKAGARDLHVPAPVLAEVMSARRKVLAALLAQGIRRPCPWIFCKADGSPLNPGTVSARFSHVKKKLGYDCKLHSLRHLLASSMVSDKLDIKKIQSQMGHSSPAVTLNIYTHILKNEEVASWIDEHAERLIKGL